MYDGGDGFAAERSTAARSSVCEILYLLGLSGIYAIYTAVHVRTKPSLSRIGRALP